MTTGYGFATTTYSNLPPDLALRWGHQGCWPNRDCSCPGSQVCWHSHLAPTPNPFQFSEDWLQAWVSQLPRTAGLSGRREPPESEKQGPPAASHQSGGARVPAVPWVCKCVRERGVRARTSVWGCVRAWLRVCALRSRSRAGRGWSPPPTALRNLSESPSGSAY